MVTLVVERRGPSLLDQVRHWRLQRSVEHVRQQLGVGVVDVVDDPLGIGIGLRGWSRFHVTSVAPDVYDE